MIITPTDLAQACVIDLEKHADERGFLARSFCREDFIRHGLPGEFVQCNISFNARRGTLRGLHFQAEPAVEGKLVRCISGAVFDVMVDLRPHSISHRSWRGFHLSQENRRALYIPPGFAHGFQTLTDNAELFYQMSAAYQPALDRGLRWDDPALGILWPLPDPILSPRDAAFPLLGG
ncbi:MAG: dTDP-4-dehydrorhamnose 3,5-epimerase [Rhodospirillales bacterium]|nr:dTDP-4-dehydrorhamnose 3,5-epimerase [Rhodospirillales bacterium]MDE2200190.1 dTDP-4-dehydrorhamnose 3,5-epimerase [Rhodospirillales bacterium]MDE2575654.1 dTDP-4-dehydrorhamnose 3,5-epimerase [Rhodospirillales bacterium]